MGDSSRKNSFPTAGFVTDICSMDKFNIKGRQNLTGIKAHTFRIWEDATILKPKEEKAATGITIMKSLNIF